MECPECRIVTDLDVIQCKYCSKGQCIECIQCDKGFVCSICGHNICSLHPSHDNICDSCYNRGDEACAVCRSNELHHKFRCKTCQRDLCTVCYLNSPFCHVTCSTTYFNIQVASNDIYCNIL